MSLPWVGLMGSRVVLGCVCIAVGGLCLWEGFYNVWMRGFAMGEQGGFQWVRVVGFIVGFNE
jgi:hypothetical protein